MKNVFYRISYYFDGDEPIHLFGVVQNSLLPTITELQLGGIEEFTVTLYTAEEFNDLPDKPYTIPV